MTDYDPRHDTPKTHPLLSNSTYDKLKKFNQLVLPAFGTLYVGLAALWGLPNPQAVAGTTLLLATFIGVVLTVATSTYNKSDEKFDGVMNVVETDDKLTYQLDLNDGPEGLKQQEQIALRVGKPE